MENVLLSAFHGVFGEDISKIVVSQIVTALKRDGDATINRLHDSVSVEKIMDLLEEQELVERVGPRHYRLTVRGRSL